MSKKREQAHTFTPTSAFQLNNQQVSALWRTDRFLDVYINKQVEKWDVLTQYADINETMELSHDGKTIRVTIKFEVENTSE